MSLNFGKEKGLWVKVQGNCTWEKLKRSALEFNARKKVYELKSKGTTLDGKEKCSWIFAKRKAYESNGTALESKEKCSCIFARRKVYEFNSKGSVLECKGNGSTLELFCKEQCSIMSRERFMNL